MYRSEGRARVHAHTILPPGAAGLPRRARTCISCAHHARACTACVAGGGCRRGLQEAPLDLSLNPTSDPNPNPNPDPNRGQVLGQQGLPSTPLELRRCLFLCSTALHCAAAASRCACTYYTAPTPPAARRTPARRRTPPHAPEYRAHTKLVLLAFTAIAPDGTSGACSS